MVMTEHRSEEWRNVIAAIRNCYHGLVSYNTDKYQEENVTWWDCVDLISSSGYYPIDQWEQELDRIEKIVQKFKKPFFFAEAMGQWFRHVGVGSGSPIQKYCIKRYQLRDL